METPVKYRNGLVGTTLFHGAVLLILLHSALHISLPSPAEQGGILVDFGNSDTGFGDYEPRMSDPAPVQLRLIPPLTSRQEEQILTQDMEETANVTAKPPKKEQPKPTVETPKETPQETATVTQPVEQPVPQRIPDARSLYPGRGDPASTATSQGEAGGQGNQGVPTGAPDVHVYGEGGDVGGGGNKWALSGRTLVGKLPKPEYKVQDEGTVVVTITVDKYGNVTKATPGAKGSTTLNKSLLDAAEKAALQTKFDRKPDAVEQIGTITYIFKLQGE